MSSTVTASSELAEAIRSTEFLLLRFLDGFDDDFSTAQPPGLPNHVCWLLGHLALTMHRAAERIGGGEVPLNWDPEPYAFGSNPSAQREDSPPLAEMVERYRAALHLLADTVAAASHEDLAREVSWGRSSTTARDLAARMVWHNGVHTGQLLDIRRALGLPRVLG